LQRTSGGVAFLAGAWIETLPQYRSRGKAGSPSRFPLGQKPKETSSIFSCYAEYPLLYKEVPDKIYFPFFSKKFCGILCLNY
jgi:hypothetical protein